jgi:hypothetical protein
MVSAAVTATLAGLDRAPRVLGPRARATLAT